MSQLSRRRRPAQQAAVPARNAAHPSSSRLALALVRRRQDGAGRHLLTST